MKIFRSPQAFQKWRRGVKPNKSIGFVPTMGALHDGHLSLMKKCHRENDVAVVSIFVNPIQFGPKEDFKKYPRPWKDDLKKLKKIGVKYIFAPTAVSMYASHNKTIVGVPALSHVLCGETRFRGPGHFQGVATVVAKLFNIVRPTTAYFGLKDFQQVRVIETMNDDLNFGIKIVRCPTLREPDGLAMSSRNAYLSPRERALAPRLHFALQQGRKLLRSRPKMNPQAVCQYVKKILASTPEFKIEYIELVDPVTLQRPKTLKWPHVMAIAARLGSTRLIDNIWIN